MKKVSPQVLSQMHRYFLHKPTPPFSDDISVTQNPMEGLQKILYLVLNLVHAMWKCKRRNGVLKKNFYFSAKHFVKSLIAGQASYFNIWVAEFLLHWLGCKE
jgi:hypothetical protein